MQAGSASFGSQAMDLDGNILKVRKDLRWDDYHPFESNCRQLLRADGNDIVVDLSEAGHMFSTVIGILAATAVEARQKKKQLILRIPDGLRWVAETAGLHEVLTIEASD